MSMVHEITSQTPRNKRPMRKGRGRSAGKGKTCGKGTKGMNARTGPGERTGYEGGQTEIFRRFPKRGFNNVNFETKYYVVNLSDLDKFDDGATVDAAALIAKGLIRDTRHPLKILGNGVLTKRLTVSAVAYSLNAIRKIASAGGTVQDAAGVAVDVQADDSSSDSSDSGRHKHSAAVEGSQPSVGDQPESGTRSADAPGAANVTELDVDKSELQQD